MSSSLPRPFGPYLLLARLGKGGSGAAYLARHRNELHHAPIEVEPLVVKCLHPQLTRHREFLKRFRHEADVAIRVSSPHVVRVLDAGRVGDQPYIAMDYVRGWTLSRINTRMAETDVRLAIPLALELILQMLQGLVALHEATDRDGRPLQTVHRDLAPKNLMVGDDGRVRLIDLGLGKSRAQDWKTDTGTVMGSPGYMAPEQIAGRDVDQRADLYAAGVVLFELLAGHRYITPGPPVDMLRQAVKQPYTPPSARRKEVPPALDAIVGRAMHPKPEARFESARALIAALQQQLPKRPGAGAVRRLTEQLLGPQQRARDEELRRLLGQADPSAPEPELETEVYIRPSADPEPAPTVTRTPPEPTQTWTRSSRRPARRAATVLAAVVAGFGAGVVLLVVVGSPWPALRLDAAGPGSGPDSSPRETASFAATASATEPGQRRTSRALDPSRSAPPVRPVAASPDPSEPDGPDRGSPGEVDAPASAATEPPARPARSSRRRRARIKTAARRRPDPAEEMARPPSDPPPTVAVRLARLQRQIGEQLDALRADDPRRPRLVRLSGRLSMLQAGAASATAEAQLDGFERALAEIMAAAGP